MKTAIVLTTIGVPELLRGYAANLEQHGHRDVGFIVIGDMKTPHKEAARLMAEIRGRGFAGEYWDIERQEQWLKRFPRLAQIIPYNSDNRRNLGYLLALEKGAEAVIVIDDDNYSPEDEDFLAGHSIVGQEVELAAVHSSNHWFNPCSLLDVRPSVSIYARGFPFSKRWQGELTFRQEKGKVMANMGLWTQDPDVDAVTRLALPVKVLGLKTDQLMLGHDTYMPINSQNTAVHRDALPCFYYVLMGANIDGIIMDRYGDIWAGLFLKKALAQMGHRITVGRPMVRHQRNQHDLLLDLQNELWGMILTEHLVPRVQEMKLREKTYTGIYREMADNIRGLSLHPHPTVKEYLRNLAGAMDTWLDACDALLNS